MCPRNASGRHSHPPLLKQRRTIGRRWARAWRWVAGRVCGAQLFCQLWRLPGRELDKRGLLFIISFMAMISIDNQYSHMNLLLLLTLLLIGTIKANPCQTHLAELAQLFILDKPEFIKQVHGYLLYSGKTVNDLGLPESCKKYPAYSYFTGEVRGEGEQLEHRAYIGLCFSSKCSAEDMQQNAGLVINTLLNISIITNGTSMAFTEPSLEVTSTPGQIVCIIFFLLLIVGSLKESVFTFFRSCVKQTKKEDEQLYGKYAIQFGQDYDPTLLVVHENEGFFKKHCLFTKMHQYFIAEESTKIVAFSALRILAVPLALYGYLFYLANIASFNYNAFEKEVYEQKFSKIAIAAYYIPDTLFFISAFLFAKKAFALIEVEPRAGKALFRLFTNKLLHWLPIYWGFILIYWQISPALHAGPVWYEYQQQAGTCSSNWWQALLFIDNWFENGCYGFAWFVPVQIQLSLLATFLLWVYLKNNKVGFVLIILLTLATWILTLTISAPFPSSMESILSYNALTYFKSTYSHMPYYLLGLINGYLAYHDKSKETMQKLTRNKCFRVIGICLGFSLLTLVVVRPSIWQSQLSFQLGLAKTGMFLAMYLLMFWSMFGEQSRTSVIHRIATLSKGTMLIGGIVVASYYWGGYSFPYLDHNYLFKTTVSNLFIAIPVGAVLAALFWEKPRKEEAPIL